MTLPYKASLLEGPWLLHCKIPCQNRKKEKNLSVIDFFVQYALLYDPCLLIYSKDKALRSPVAVMLASIN